MSDKPADERDEAERDEESAGEAPPAEARSAEAGDQADAGTEAGTETETETEAEAGTEAEQDGEWSTTPERQGAHRPWLLGLAAVVTLASLFGPISASGIWDPHELRIADLARRIALNLLGGHNLALQDAVNSVPTLGELARGQLPFSSVAVGFRLFGLHAWAGRLPLALWGLVGVLVTYALVSRLADRAAGAFAALALSTMPLYFLHARTILGDIVTISAIAIATAGLGIAAFDREPGVKSYRTSRRTLWLLFGLIGLGAGFGARGVLIGVAIPALGVGATWLVALLSGRHSRERLGDAAGALSLLIGAAALFIGLKVLFGSPEHAEHFSALLGAKVDRARQRPAFDYVIMYLGHGLFPWSALIPFAIARMLRAPTGVNRASFERESSLRMLLLTVAAVGYGVYSVMAPTVGHLPFGAVAAFAGIVALALRDFERGAPGSRTIAMGVAAFAVFFYEDFREIPIKGLSAFGIKAAKFPDSFKQTGIHFIELGTAVFLLLFFFSFMERQREAGQRFDRDEYLAWPRQLVSLWNGNLLFGAIVAEASLAGIALLSWLSHRFFHWQQFESMGAMERKLAYVAWIALPIVFMLLPAGALLLRDCFRYVYGRFKLSRAAGSMLGVVACGLTLSLGYYPALAAQISPKEVFESYKTLAHRGEALGMMGVSAGSASYYAGREVPTFGTTTEAFNWLMQGAGRRWLVSRADALPEMNSMFRRQTNPPRNLPVLDARSSEIMLVSNKLGSSEDNKNPFDNWILTGRPKPMHPLDGNFGGQLDAIGWSVATPDGKPADAVVPGRPYKLTLYYKVIAPISGNWKTFVHIDGFQRRFNADHDTLEGKYPFNLWHVGDYIADIHEFSLEPNFTPGDYHLFFGLFIGNRRLPVKRGRAHDNRLEAGVFRVR